VGFRGVKVANSHCLFKTFATKKKQPKPLGYFVTIPKLNNNRI